MTPKQIVALAVRLFAIFLIYVVTQSIPVTVQYYFNGRPDEHHILLSRCLGYAWKILLAIFCWNFPHVVAGKILPDIRDGAPPTPALAETWFRVGCSLMGVYFLITAFASTAEDAFLYLKGAWSQDMIYGYMVRNAVLLVAGCWLLLGNKGLVGLVRYLREAKYGER